MQIYEKINLYIKQHNINQDELAKKCSISPDAFNDMLCGTRKMYAEDLRVICYALEVSPEIFIDYT